MVTHDLSSTRRSRVNLRFLIVDDEDYYATQLRNQILRVTGQQGGVLVVNSLDAAFQAVTHQTFDVCFIDYDLASQSGGLSEKNGGVHTLARALVFVCDGASRESAFRALSFGAQEFLIKSNFSGFDVAKGISYSLYWKYHNDELAARLAQQHNGDNVSPTVFDEHLRHAIEVAKRGKERVGLMMIGLKDIDPIMEDYGQEVGGELLDQVGERITHNVRASDIVTRLSTRKFGAILCKVASPIVVKNISNTVSQAISAQPYTVQSHSLKINVSIGATTYPDDAASMDQLKALAQDLLVSEQPTAATESLKARQYDYY